MSEWVARSALADILKEDFSQLNEDRLYRNMDRFHGKRGPIEAALCAKEKSLFSLKESILLYDLTSTYFEGLCLSNPKAKRGYSRDSRPDANRYLSGWCSTGRVFPERTKSLPVIAATRPRWPTCCWLSVSRWVDCGRPPRFMKPSALKERYPRVARYYHLTYNEQQAELSCSEDVERKQKAESLDGSYLLKSSRSDLSAEDIWRTYVLLTRVEAAFRAMKSPLCERPLFHHLERRVETHIFLCVLAYHLLVCVEGLTRISHSESVTSG